jgi:hypothetical protein
LLGEQGQTGGQQAEKQEPFHAEESVAAGRSLHSLPLARTGGLR